ncbi:MAG: betaine/proline/choline family ABC transporter ATP-binding protein [Actinobacteria bacterium]|nr:betaine/proline/choline family ABC transporter ATP-binding protein [Actinomycetota bacterium]
MSDSQTHPAPAGSGPEPMIRLEELSKRFPRQQEYAVENLSMDIPAGEIVVLVGPSGCGKTTTMRLINRLIEPTSGKIILEGEDVTDVDSDALRRRMGYVIQQIGLFPHVTIAGNIAIVPRMLGWKRERISRRVDELLELVGMDPDAYRDRYPKELSGGQRQRVGVARAMAADPPVILMDEPFSAIDPITRDRLQNEFLRLQAVIKKTIVFVTHDIDEAVKLGDRIAILRDQSKIAQYDTPEHVLTNPADSYVEDFVGAGAAIRRLNLSRVDEVEHADWPIVQLPAEPADVREALRGSSKSAVLLLDQERRPFRWVAAPDLDRPERLESGLGSPALPVVRSSTTLHTALNEMLKSGYGSVIVVDEKGAYEGVIDLETVMNAVHAMRAEALEHASELEQHEPVEVRGS